MDFLVLGDFRGVLVLVQNNPKTPVHALAKRVGERGGDHALHWLVVGMSLTSRGSGGKRNQSSVCFKLRVRL